jgi:hypothetical protein
VHRCASVIEAAHVRNVLEACGIPAQLKNDRLWGAVGEIPILEAWPQVWVEHEADAARARDCLRALERAPDAPAWACPGCGEPLEGQFVSCWRCGRERGAPAQRRHRAL